MSHWPACKARRVLAALLRIGWRIKRQSGSHRTLSRAGWDDCVCAFHDDSMEAIGLIADGTTDLVFTPLEFFERLAGLAFG